MLVGWTFRRTLHCPTCTLLEVKGCIPVSVSRVVVASDKIPPQSSFKLQDTYACLKDFPQLMLPAKHGYGTWETPWTFSFMLTREMTLGKLLYLCVPMSLQVHSGVSFTTSLGRRCWKELHSFPRPSLPTSKVHRSPFQKTSLLSFSLSAWRAAV